MSLIIYHEEAIYADRAFATANLDGDIRYSEKAKLFTSKCGQIAFVVCGIRPKEKDLEEYVLRLRCIFLALQKLEYHKKNPLPEGALEETKKRRKTNNDYLLDSIAKFADEIRQHQDGKIFAITTEIAISLDMTKFIKKEDITSIFEGPSCAYGTGSAYWDMFANNGLEPADCYEHAWKVDETISKNFDMVAMEQLKPLTQEVL